MSFESLGLCDHLQKSLKDLGYNEATEVQQKAIPLILGGGDVLAAAQTGSGKTAAFALPLLQRFHEDEGESGVIRALILVPTRELAIQVGGWIDSYAKQMPTVPDTLVVVGGKAINPQIDAAEWGTDILVATPGRLLDLVERDALDLSGVEMLILDEADRLLALGFADEMNSILALLQDDRQNLLFSATFPKSVVEMADKLLKEPTKIQMETESQTVENIAQRAIEVDRNSRTALLRHLIETEGWTRVLVFVATKRRAANVAVKLSKQGIKATALHGDLKQDQRTKSLEAFQNSKVQVLMATDVAARGIDIAQLPCVVNYDLPRSPTDYVHRIGRTGRAGESGLAVNFITQEEHKHFELIEKRQGTSLERERLEGFEPTVWDPDSIVVPTAPVKGKRKSKKDKLREAKAKSRGDAPWTAMEKVVVEEKGDVQESEPEPELEPVQEPEPEPETPDLDVSNPWAQALRKAKDAAKGRNGE